MPTQQVLYKYPNGGIVMDKRQANDYYGMPWWGDNPGDKVNPAFTAQKYLGSGKQWVDDNIIKND
jgi:hypothetical protein